MAENTEEKNPPGPLGCVREPPGVWPSSVVGDNNGKLDSLVEAVVVDLTLRWDGESAEAKGVRELAEADCCEREPNEDLGLFLVGEGSCSSTGLGGVTRVEGVLGLFCGVTIGSVSETPSVPRCGVT